MPAPRYLLGLYSLYCREKTFSNSRLQLTSLRRLEIIVSNP